MNPMNMLNDIIEILKLRNSFTTKKENCKEINYELKNDGRLQSFISSVLYIGQQSNGNFNGNSLEDENCVYQWLEYYLLNSGRMENEEVLAELNLYLKDYVYLAKESYTIADLVMYLRFHKFFVELSFQEKEAYPNISRWFRNVQNQVSAHDLYPKITFSKTKLYI